MGHGPRTGALTRVFAVALLALALVGCGRSSHSAKAAGGRPSGTTTTTASGATNGAPTTRRGGSATPTTKAGSPGTAAHSAPPTIVPPTGAGPTTPPDTRLAALKRLSAQQLCGALTTSEAAQLLGQGAKAPTYSTAGGVTCTWVRTDGRSHISVSVASYLTWQTAQLAVSFNTALKTTIDGHPAFVVGAHGNEVNVLVTVASGGSADPAVQFRGPNPLTTAKLAQMVMPRLAALV